MANYIWLEFADGQYLFHLKMRRIGELEAKRKAGFGEIYVRCTRGMVPYEDDSGKVNVYPTEAGFHAEDIVEIIRQGMIGGGLRIVDGVESEVKDHEVNRLLASYLEDRPLVKAWEIAASILLATMEGYSPPKKT